MKKLLAFVTLLLSIVVYRMFTTPALATFTYIIVSYFKDFDSNTILDNNYDGEIEDEIFMHRFVHLNKTYRGMPVNVTYHAVECGDRTAEPIVFAHGLCENWRFDPQLCIYMYIILYMCVCMCVSIACSFACWFCTMCTSDLITAYAGAECGRTR